MLNRTLENVEPWRFSDRHSKNTTAPPVRILNQISHTAQSEITMIAVNKPTDGQIHYRQTRGTGLVFFAFSHGENSSTLSRVKNVTGQ